MVKKIVIGDFSVIVGTVVEIAIVNVVISSGLEIFTLFTS